MRNLLRTDLFHMFRTRVFWGSALCMLFVAIGLIFMQRTAMDYTVPFSRVIFLPLSFYGAVVAAMAAMFVSGNFTSGDVRNKLIAGHGRRGVYLSHLVVTSAACVAVFALTTAFTAAISFSLFEMDVGLREIGLCFAIGASMCLAYAALYCLISTLICDRARSVVACMALAFGMLFLSMQLHSRFSRQASAPVSVALEYLYDLIPTGQAAQLSSMNCLHPARCVLLNLFWVAVSIAAGCGIFRKKDIR